MIDLLKDVRAYVGAPELRKLLDSTERDALLSRLDSAIANAKVVEVRLNRTRIGLAEPIVVSITSFDHEGTPAVDLKAEPCWYDEDAQNTAASLNNSILHYEKKEEK